MHRKCNSSKNGEKGNDSIAPQPRGKCPALSPGGTCDALRVAATGRAQALVSKDDDVDAESSDVEEDSSDVEEESDEGSQSE